MADVKQKEENLEESRRKLSALVESSKKDIEEMQSIYGQAHHMFSRFLNLPFFSRNFLCCFYRVEFSIVIKNLLTTTEKDT